MIIASLIAAYMFVGFVATMSPIGQNACGGRDGCPPLIFLLIWPVAVILSLVVFSCEIVNDWLEDILR